MFFNEQALLYEGDEGHDDDSEVYDSDSSVEDFEYRSSPTRADTNFSTMVSGQRRKAVVRQEWLQNRSILKHGILNLLHIIHIWYIPMGTEQAFAIRIVGSLAL